MPAENYEEDRNAFPGMAAERDWKKTKVHEASEQLLQGLTPPGH